jgi:predicted enzyme related to lactoylglutathione lyase
MRGTAVDVLVNIDVDDLDAAVEFYRQGIGLHIGRRLFSGTVIEMLGASSPIYLLQKKSGTPASPGTSQLRAYNRHWTPVHLDFIVAQIEIAVRNAVAAGARLEGEVQTFKWGRQATLSDPFGHGLCFLQWAGNGYGEVE